MSIWQACGICSTKQPDIYLPKFDNQIIKLVFLNTCNCACMEANPVTYVCILKIAFMNHHWYKTVNKHNSESELYLYVFLINFYKHIMLKS